MHHPADRAADPKGSSTSRLPPVSLITVGAAVLAAAATLVVSDSLALTVLVAMLTAGCVAVAALII